MSEPVVLVIGWYKDPTIRHVLSVATRRGFNLAFVEMQDYLSRGTVCWSSNDVRGGRIMCGPVVIDFTTVGGIYQRAYLPDSSRQTLHSETYGRFSALETVLLATHARIVNRPLSGWENMSKPLQGEQLRGAGFLVPRSLTTSIVDDCRAFCGNGSAIYKSNSGVRSIVNRVTLGTAEPRLQRLPQCPVLFQEEIVGTDVRVHVVDGQVFPVRIRSDAVDYRYYRQHGSYMALEPLSSIDSDVAARCTSFARDRGVALSGFDFKITEKGQWYCLEMNSTPAFETYDHSLDCRIADAMLAHLVSG